MHTYKHTRMLICYRCDLHSEQVLFTDGTDHKKNGFLSFGFGDDGIRLYVNTSWCFFMNLDKILLIFREYHRNVVQIFEYDVLNENDI